VRRRLALRGVAIAVGEAVPAVDALAVALRSVGIERERERERETVGSEAGEIWEGNWGGIVCGGWGERWATRKRARWWRVAREPSPPKGFPPSRGNDTKV
jgi:hypothetical protein